MEVELTPSSALTALRLGWCCGMSEDKTWRCRWRCNEDSMIMLSATYTQVICVVIRRYMINLTKAPTEYSWSRIARSRYLSETISLVPTQLLYKLSSFHFVPTAIIRVLTLLSFHVESTRYSIHRIFNTWTAPHSATKKHQYQRLASFPAGLDSPSVTSRCFDTLNRGQRFSGRDWNLMSLLQAHRLCACMCKGIHKWHRIHRRFVWRKLL